MHSNAFDFSSDVHWWLSPLYFSNAFEVVEQIWIRGSFFYVFLKELSPGHPTPHSLPLTLPVLVCCYLRRLFKFTYN